MSDASSTPVASATTEAPVSDAGIAAIEPTASPLDPRTGEPRRPWLVWVASGLFFAGVGVVVVALLLAMWNSVDRFAEAAWLNQVVPTELGDPLRVALALGVWSSALVIGAAASITGYYSWAGFRWTRWSGLITVALGGASFLMNTLAPWCLVPLTLGAGCLWTPPVIRFFLEWQAVSHPVRRFPSVADHVRYGPLPRYR